MLKIPFLWIGICFACGIAAGRFCTVPPEPFGILLSVSLPFLLWLRGRKLFLPAFCFSVVILGFFHSEIQEIRQNNSLHRWMTRQTQAVRVGIVGEIGSEPELKIYRNKKTASYILEVEQIQTWNFKKRKTFKVRGRLQVFQHQPENILNPGDKVRLWGNLEDLPSVKNPGEFDYRQYLLDRDISGILTLYGEKSVKLLEPAPFYDFCRLLAGVRKKIRDRIQSQYSHEEAVFIQALILGDRKNITRQWKDDFLRTGTSHLLAISGLNIALAAGSFYYLLIFMGISQKKAAGCALVLTGIQVAIGGLGLPLQRAGVMAAVGFASLMTEREKSSLNNFFLAFFFLLLMDSRNFWQISFQLSFLSLLCLILFSQKCQVRWQWLEPIAGGTALLAGTFPVVVYHFHTFSVSGLIVNLLAIPLFHLVLLTALIGLAIGNLPLLGPAVILSCEQFLKWSLDWIHLSARVDWGYFFVPPPSVFQMVLYYGLLGAFFFCGSLPRFRKTVQISVAGLWLGTAVSFFQPGRQDAFQAVFFSAGTNEMCHLRFSRENQWLINAGRTFPGDQAEWILAPYLRAQGAKDLTGVLFTDYRKRHTAGLETLKRTFNFQYEIYPARTKSTHGFQKSQGYLGGGSKIRMPEGASLEILDHAREQFTFRLAIGGERILYLPAVSYSVFESLLKRTVEEKQAEILVLPSLKEQDVMMLKSLLTLTRAKKVITPVFSKEAEEIFKEKGIEGFELSTEGALRVTLEPVAGKEKFRVEPFLNL